MEAVPARLTQVDTGRWESRGVSQAEVRDTTHFKFWFLHRLKIKIFFKFTEHLKSHYVFVHLTTMWCACACLVKVYFISWITVTLQLCNSQHVNLRQCDSCLHATLIIQVTHLYIEQQIYRPVNEVLHSPEATFTRSHGPHTDRWEVWL